VSVSGAPWAWRTERIHACRVPVPLGLAPLPTRRHALTRTLLAVDLGQFNRGLCWFDLAARTARFRTAPTPPDELRRELTREPLARRACEAGSPAGRVHDLGA